MTTPVLSEHIAAYATRVRAHLADLEPDVVEDLTDGLEADLAEALADAAPNLSGTDVPGGAAATEGDELTTRFGTPEAYAGELRTAAGLPAAGPGRRRWRTRVSLRDALLEVLSPLPENLRRWAATPWGVQVAGFFRSLAPVWWVLRAWVLVSIFGDVREHLGSALILAVAVVISVQVGRGAWRPGRRGRAVVAFANVVAAIVMIPVLVTDYSPAREAVYYSSPAPMVEETEAAIWVGGERATNLFIYGPDGELIDGAQVVDQSGRPVLLDSDGALDDTMQETHFWEPRIDVNGREVWNAYPLGFWNVEMAEWNEDTGEWILPVGVAGSTHAPTIDRLVPLATDEAETQTNSPLEVEPSGEPLDTEPSPEAPSGAPSTETGNE